MEATIFYVANLEHPSQLIYISPQVEGLGHSAEELCQDPAPFVRLIHVRDHERLAAAQAAAHATGRDIEEELYLVGRDNRLIPSSIRAKLIRDDDGVPIYWHGVMRLCVSPPSPSA